MVQLIVGKRGKGKTKQLLDKANSVVKEANGSVDFLDKSAQHMYELSNKIRLINVNEFPIDSRVYFPVRRCSWRARSSGLQWQR